MNILEENRVRLYSGGYLQWTRVEKVSDAAETLTIPDLSSTTGSAVALRGPGDGALTISITDKNTLSVTGANGAKAWILTHHARSNYAPDNDDFTNRTITVG